MRHARRRIARTLNGFAALIGALIALAVPSAYFLAAYNGMSGRLEARAEAFALLVNRVVAAAPDVWQYQHDRLQAQLQRLLEPRSEERATVVDASGAAVADTRPASSPPVMTRTATLYDAGIPVGRVYVSDTLRPVIARTAYAALAGLLLAAALFYVLHTLPMKALHRALAEVEARQEEIRRLNLALEDRVAERTRALQQAVEELEEFSYSVAHDLRTPIRSVNNFAHMLKATETALRGAGEHYLERIIAASARMAALTDGLLELARIGRCRLQPVRLDLGAMARSVMREVAGALPQREIGFEADEGLFVHADAALMRLALRHLLENAVKFTSTTEQARIELRAVEVDGRRAYVLRDNGVGFDMRYAHKLFRSFQRLHAPEEFGGAGIGLATVYRILARHGGSVGLTSAAGKGTEVRFTV